jgi:hypothetical protein
MGGPTDTDPTHLNLDTMSSSGITEASQLVVGALTVAAKGSSPSNSLFPAGTTNPLTSGEAGAIYDMGGFAVNLGGPKYRAIGTWDPVAGTGDMSAAWAQAVADAAGGTVFAPDGNYNTASTLVTTIASSTAGATSVEGAGWATVFQSTTASPIMRMVASSTEHELHGVHYSHFRVDGGAIANGLWGLEIGDVPGFNATARASYIEALRFTRCSIGLQITFTQGIAVEHCKFGQDTAQPGDGMACDTGCRISDDSEIGTFLNCDFRGNTTVALLLDNSGPVSGGALVQGIYNWTFVQCHFESNAGKATVLDGATYNWFIGCKWEQNAGTYITLQSVLSGTRCDGNIWVGGYWNGNGAVPGVLLVDIQSASGTTFIGGFFSPNSNGGINIAALGTNTTFDFATVSCAVTDASSTTSYHSPLGHRFARTRFTVNPAFAANLTVDVSTGEIFYVVVTANMTVTIPTNFARAGQRVTWIISQGGAGGFTVSWTATGNGSWRQAWSDAGNVAGKFSTISFVYNEVVQRWIQDGAQGPYC